MLFSFNPLDPKTWCRAKNKQLVWDGIDLYDNEKGFITEIYFTKVMQAFFAQPRNAFDTDEKREKAAEQVIENLLNHNSFIPGFYPLEPNTWNNASEQQMLWDGIALYTQKKEPLTQLQFVKVLVAVFDFLERDGTKCTDKEKTHAAETYGKRLAKYQSLSALEHPENIEPELLDPNFHERVMNSPKVLESIDRMHRREDAWGDACSQAEAEFRAKGARKLNDATPGYLDRINEIYDSLLPRYMTPDYKAKVREVVEHNSDLPFEDENGEYIFLQEQLDALPKSDECVIKQIGKLILDSKKECCYIGKRTQQELFDVFGYLNCDWEYIVKLDGARGCPSMIKKLLHACRTCEEAFQ